MVHGTSMSDPNGHCQACGKPCPEGAHLCPNCQNTPESWNKIVGDQEQTWRKMGMNDDQIRQASDDLFGGYKAQGMQEEFTKKLEDEAVKKALGE